MSAVEALLYEDCNRENSKKYKRETSDIISFQKYFVLCLRRMLMGMDVWMLMGAITKCKASNIEVAALSCYTFDFHTSMVDIL